MSRNTKKWVTESLYPRVVAYAHDAWVDTSGWLFGQLVGLNLTLMEQIPGGGMTKLGSWSKASEAVIGLEAMIEAFLLVTQARKRG
jgi:hypothetical protein